MTSEQRSHLRPNKNGPTCPTQSNFTADDHLVFTGKTDCRSTDA